jgi:hypothetical protein
VIWEESSLGERGARLKIEGDAEGFAERFNERFGWCRFDLLGVAGRDGSTLSSLLGGRLKSPVAG